MRRRDFIALTVGAAVSWPLVRAAVGCAGGWVSQCSFCTNLRTAIGGISQKGWESNSIPHLTFAASSRYAMIRGSFRARTGRRHMTLEQME
jgi:hypothetical protein